MNEPRVEFDHLDWPCCLCGTQAGLDKYEIATARFRLNAVPTPVGLFQRHFCRPCAGKADDVLMAALDDYLTWHNCDLGLPAEPDEYQVCVTDAGSRWTTTATFSSANGWVEPGTMGLFFVVRLPNVTHWARLPKLLPLPEGV